MKAISFLGTTDYKETTYFWDGCEFRTRFFGETLPHFFPELERVLVFITPTVQRHSNWAELQRRLGDLGHPVPIPEGHSEGELWEIFDALTGAVSENETVIFDITNSFRSIPLLVFLAAAYLRTARRVQVHRIIYGAWEARDKETDRSPVFDLTPFVTLLDWLTATNQFIYTGDARFLAHQLSKQQEPALAPLISTVEQISLGLHLLRPVQVSESAYKLAEDLQTARQALPSPFALLANQVTSSYGQFGLEPEASLRCQLTRQLAMINWYHQAGQIVQALSLAREWLVSLLCMHFNLDMYDPGQRDEIEFLLNGGVLKDEDGVVRRQSPYLDQFRTLSDSKRLRRLWGGDYQLAKLRNDVLHSGFRKNPKPIDQIIQLTSQIVQELNEIAAQWHIAEATQ